MGIASSLKKVTSKALKAVGGSVVFRKVTAGSYNEETGKIVESFLDTTIKGVIQNVSNSEVNDLIQAQDKTCLISAGDLDFVPTPKDRVLINSIVYKIVQVRTEEQDNIPVAFTLFLRS
tara:strand:+ start:3297 stop:3653 length:357 start_codon:yes stop_codon:yes gene_type:complete